MDTQNKGAFTRIRTKLHAHAAALRHGNPSKNTRVVLVVGQDGAIGVVAFLASMLRAAGERVGVVTQQYVEIGNERASGSDKADINGDPYRLQSLLAHMRKAKCGYVLIEVPSELPVYEYAGLNPTMVIIRRCGDDNIDQVTITARLAMLRTILDRQPTYVVFNRDDPRGTELAQQSGGEGVISFGTHQKAECQITQVQLHPKGSAIDLLVDHQTQINLATPLTGKQTIYNLAAAAAGAYVLHAPIEAIEQGAINIPELPGHLQYVPVVRPYRIVIDAAVTPEGLVESLEALKHFAKNRLIVVFGTPLGAPPSWRSVMGEIISKAADRLVICDGEYAADQSPAQIREQLLQGVVAAGGEAKTDEIADRRAAIEKAVSIARRGDIILIAASTLRPYRQLGGERLTWSDYRIIEELFEG